MNSEVVVITGASGGIGATLAKQLGGSGYKLALAARREPELRQVAEQSGAEAIAVKCDVTRRREVENLREAALNRFGRIDIWVNNAGRGINRKVLELSDEDFNEIINVNLRSALYGMQAITPYFQEQGQGHIINISSFLGRVPYVTFRSIYSASKAALNMLTANLRMDLKADYPGIHVSLVMPGGVATDFSKNALGGKPQAISKGGFMKWQTPEEAAAAIFDLIKNPRAEIYTNPALGEIALKYYQDVGVFEERMRQSQ